MGDFETLDILIEDIYAGAFGKLTSTGLLERIACCLGYSAAGIVTARSMFSEPVCSFGWNIDIRKWTRAERQFGIQANLAARLGRPMLAGEFAFRDELMSDEELQAQPWFPLLAAEPAMQDGMRICLENSPERSIFAVFRNPVPWPEQPEDRAQRTRLAARLAPHWVRATHLYLQIDLVDVLRRAYAEAANMVPYAMVVFDNGGDVFLVNAKAQRLITGDGLILRRHGLHALDDTEHQALQDAISAVIEANLRHRPQKRSKDVIVSRPSGRRAYQVIVKPLSPGRFGDGRRPAAAAVIVDPDEEFIVTLERCQEIFGFTRAEAQVALGIMQGRSLEQIAETHGNTVITARNLLKRAFNKAGVKRQNELTRLLLNSPLLFDLDSDTSGM